MNNYESSPEIISSEHRAEVITDSLVDVQAIYVLHIFLVEAKVNYLKVLLLMRTRATLWNHY